MFVSEHPSGCGQHWRKKIEVPEGWEIVPAGALEDNEMMFFRKFGQKWEPNEIPLKPEIVDYYKDNTRTVFVFIRRKSTPTEIVEKGKSFYVVLVDPDKTFATEELALSSAGACAKEYNKEFFVMKAVASCVQGEPVKKEFQ
jgi:hypothetical protein